MKTKLSLALPLMGTLLLLSTGTTAFAQDTGDDTSSEDEVVDVSTPGAEADEERAEDKPKELSCNDGKDEDHDGLTDCSDADCFNDAACATGGDERTEEQCSDWIDNDGDDSIDCEDDGCSGTWYCRGSLRDQRDKEIAGREARQGTQTKTTQSSTTQVEPDAENIDQVQDLVGKGDDAGGENNDFVCSDGIDNDGDGRTDCEDYGCRYDPAVAVCDHSHGYNFSIVAGIGADMTMNKLPSGFTKDPVFDARFSRLQIRALGQIPLINNSFFLLSARMERSPRLTFATFQVPIGGAGHYFSVNSGSANLSTNIVLSAAKRPLLDAPFYLTNAFEEGNGAALEVGGPLIAEGLLDFRVFAAGGSGESNGNVGGRFFRSDDRNFSWGAGAQFTLNVIGRYNRFDSRFLYLEKPTGLAFAIGGKFDQRPLDRYPSGHALVHFNWKRLMFHGEFYYKYSLETKSSQLSWNTELSVLLVPKTLVIAADAGSFYAQPFQTAVAKPPKDPLDEFNWRVALSYFWFRDKGLLSLRYSEKYIDENPNRPEDAVTERQVRLEAQFRF